jgi:hypothetical protein
MRLFDGSLPNNEPLLNQQVITTLCSTFATIKRITLLLRLPPHSSDRPGKTETCKFSRNEATHQSHAHFSLLSKSPISAQARLSTAFTIGPSSPLSYVTWPHDISTSPIHSSPKHKNTCNRATMSDTNPPAPAYFPTSADSPLHPPTALYSKLRTVLDQASEDGAKSKLLKTQDFLIPARSGKAWTVPATALFRLSTPEGPQVRTYFHQHHQADSVYIGRRPKHLVRH